MDQLSVKMQYSNYQNKVTQIYLTFSGILCELFVKPTVWLQVLFSMVAKYAYLLDGNSDIIRLCSKK